MTHHTSNAARRSDASLGRKGLGLGWVVRWRLLGLWGVLGLALCGGAHAQAQAPAYEARVTRVFDGDTVWVRPVAGGRYRKLRLDGLDAPEICQTGGTASRDALAARVKAQTVWVTERRRDDYGRALVRLSLAGDDVGAWLVRQGHAWSYRWRNHPGPFAAEEAEARHRRRGVFSDPLAENPRDFRRRNGPCPMP